MRNRVDFLFRSQYHADCKRLLASIFSGSSDVGFIETSVSLSRMPTASPNPKLCVRTFTIFFLISADAFPEMRAASSSRDAIIVEDLRQDLKVETGLEIIQRYR